MWKQYMVYYCPKCKYETKTSIPIYRFDDDDHHYAAFEGSPGMKAALSEVQLTQCPECGAKERFEFKGWFD